MSSDRPVFKAKSLSMPERKDESLFSMPNPKCCVLLTSQVDLNSSIKRFSADETEFLASSPKSVLGLSSFEVKVIFLFFPTPGTTFPVAG